MAELVVAPRARMPAGLSGGLMEAGDASPPLLWCLLTACGNELRRCTLLGRPSFAIQACGLSCMPRKVPAWQQSRHGRLRAVVGPCAVHRPIGVIDTCAPQMIETFSLQRHLQVVQEPCPSPHPQHRCFAQEDWCARAKHRSHQETHRWRVQAARSGLLGLQRSPQAS